MKKARSEAAWRRAVRVMPGGVNSPVRAHLAVGGSPPFVASARGSAIVDLDGRRYVDYVMSWGPLLLGHAAPAVVRAVRDAARRGLTYGAPTKGEVELAELVRTLVPSIGMLRLVTSGTEACMSAIRAARGFTGRDAVVKFEGCYHGHADSMLVKAGSGLATFGSPDSAGVPADLAKHTIVVPYNDLAAVEAALASTPVAAVIVEPVAGNMGVVPPEAHFLPGLRRLCTDHGALLIFDEVISGFRLSAGGAQAVVGVKPDLTTLGKILGGGLPIGAYGGRRDVMEKIAPLGPVYQAGTLAGNPVAVAAGLATLRALKGRARLYRELERFTERLASGLEDLAKRFGVAATVNRAGSMLTVFFTEGPVTDWSSASRSDRGCFSRFFRAMLEGGIWLPPSPFEAWFVSASHTERDLEKTLTAARRGFEAAAG